MIDLFINGSTITISQEYWYFLSGLAGILAGAGFMFGFFKAIISG